MNHNRLADTWPPVSDSDLDIVERRINRQLPQGLRRLYLHTNGGYPERSVFVGGEDDYEVQVVLPVVHGQRTLESVYELIVLTKQLIPPHLIPFANNSGGDYYCVDDRGRVFFVAMDPPNEPPIQIAASIEEFLNGMVTPEEAY